MASCRNKEPVEQIKGQVTGFAADVLHLASAHRTSSASGRNGVFAEISRRTGSDSKVAPCETNTLDSDADEDCSDADGELGEMRLCK